MQTATADSLVGRVLDGRYRILDRVARGGMSTVYAAVDERLDRLVALKVMSGALSSDPAFSDRFAREARAAARLTHVNVVSVYDQGHEIAADGHHVFLVMELVEGRTLRELIHERGPLSPAEAVSLMEPVLGALAAAHRAGLVHRDVKPENILISDEGLVKVADFGLARATETDPTSTRTGLMMGTVAYCPPEQLSRGNFDPRSDVYSAGIVLFELLTGEQPYRGEAMQIAYQHVHARVPAPSSRVRGLPTELDELVVAATDSDPTARPVDAGAFLAELADLRTALALPVTPVPARERTTRRPDHRQHRSVGPRGAAGTPESTTAALHGHPGRHDTSVVPGRETGRDTARDPRRGAGRDEPPPPVVIPPSRGRRAGNRGGPGRRRRRGLLVLLLVLALGVGAFFGARAFIAWRFAHVPKVTGLSEQRALAALRDAGYEPKVDPGPEFSETYDKGAVLRTDPQVGSRLATGHTVVITLSAGPHLYALPTVKGKDFADARSAVQSIGPVTIATTPTLQYNDTIPKGTVIGTNPAAGSKVRASQRITIVVSNGVPDVAIPAVRGGLSYESMRAKLRALHFSVQRIDSYDDSVAEGDVISVSPSGSAPKFSVVTVTVSRGHSPVTVPNIPVGTSVADATTQLENLGLVVKNNQVGVANRPDPVVWSVQPGPGSLVEYGSTVTLTSL